MGYPCTYINMNIPTECFSYIRVPEHGPSVNNYHKYQLILSCFYYLVQEEFIEFSLCLILPYNINSHFT